MNFSFNLFCSLMQFVCQIRHSHPVKTFGRFVQGTDLFQLKMVWHQVVIVVAVFVVAVVVVAVVVVAVFVVAVVVVAVFVVAVFVSLIPTGTFVRVASVTILKTLSDWAPFLGNQAANPGVSWKAILI